jgi:hypothetical protein
MSLASRTEMKRVIDDKSSDPIERELVQMFSRERLLALELKPFVSQACHEAQVLF